MANKRSKFSPEVKVRLLRLAITESKSGRQPWAAKIFINASGNGAVKFVIVSQI